MLMYRCKEWSRLPGARVEVRRGGRTMRVGMVEDAMADDSAVWLAADGVEGRTLIEAAAYYEIWIEPKVFYSLL